MAEVYAELRVSPTGRNYLQCPNCDVSVSLPMSPSGYTDPEAQVIAYRVNQMIQHANEVHSDANRALPAPP